MRSQNYKLRPLLLATTAILGLLVSVLSPVSVKANVPELIGKVESESGTPIEYIHIKWQDVSGGVRFAKTDAAGAYRFPSMSDYRPDPNYIPTPIPWNTSETGDEGKRLIDIWKVNNFTQEFVYYPERVVNGETIPQSSWSCLSNPNKFSVVIPESFNCDQVVIDRSSPHIDVCDSIYFDSGPYHKSEVCQIDLLANAHDELLLPDFVCEPKETLVSGSVMCENPTTGALYPVTGGSVEVDGASYPVQNGRYTTAVLPSETMIASRLTLPATISVTVDGASKEISTADTSIQAPNGCSTNFMNVNCGGINAQRAAQCAASSNVAGSYEWCTLPVNGAARNGFDFVIKNCTLPTVGCGQVSAITSDMDFVVDTAGQYALRTITWQQASEATPLTQSFDVRMYPDTAPGSAITRTLPKSATCSGLNCSYTADEPTVRALHSMLTAASTNKLRIQITPNVAGGTSCMSDGIAQSVTSPIIPTTSFR